MQGGALVTAHLKCCPACNEGLVRFDPQTGESRCGSCFSRGDAPLVMGGQGRDAGSVSDDATGCAIVLAGCAVVAAAIVWMAVRS